MKIVPRIWSWSESRTQTGTEALTTTKMTTNWYDIMVTEEDRLLALDLDDWNAEKRRIVEERGKASWAFINRIDFVRRTLWHAKKDSRPATQDPPQLRYYRDVADEPWKYGDDAFEQWNALDDDLPNYPGRWRVAAYWARREDEEILEPARQRLNDLLTKAQSEFTEKMAAATKIQALVRGHQLRCSVRFMDCAECLKHGAAPHEVEGRNLCRTCYDTLGWQECSHCGMPVHQDRMTDFVGCCSRECLEGLGFEEVGDLVFPEPDECSVDEPPVCGGCGCVMDEADKDDYRQGYWCSRACAYG